MITPYTAYTHARDYRVRVRSRYSLDYLEEVSLLKKSLSDQSVVRNTQEPRPKHYKTVDLNP
jgi:hypothetical protein